MSDTHYVANLKIEKVDKKTSQMQGGDKRDITEVTQFVIKAETLVGLTQKLTKHIDIIEED